MWQRPGELGGAAVLILYVAAVCAVVLFYPQPYWDMIAYVATIYEFDGTLGHDLHVKAYGLVQRNVSEVEFAVLTGGGPFRKAQYADPDAFITMLGFYRVNLLYIDFAQFLTNWVDPLAALRWVSTISAAAIGLLTLLWLGQNRCLTLAPLAIVALIISGYVETAWLPTPDLFSAVFLVAGVLLFVNGRNLSAGIALVLASLARPDHLPLVGVFAIMTIIIRPISISMIVAFVASIAGFLTFNGMSAHPGWWVHFWFNSIEYVHTLDGFNPEFSVLTYLQAVGQSATKALIEQTWVGVLLALIFSLALLLRKNFAFTRPEAIAMSALLIAIPVKFLIFPLSETRFYFAYVIALALILIAAYARQREPLSFSLPTITPLPDNKPG